MTPNPKTFRNFPAAPLVTFLFLAINGIITWRNRGDKRAIAKKKTLIIEEHL